MSYSDRNLIVLIYGNNISLTVVTINEPETKFKHHVASKE